MPSCMIDVSAHSHTILLTISDNASYLFIISNKRDKVFVGMTILFYCEVLYDVPCERKSRILIPGEHRLLF